MRLLIVDDNAVTREVIRDLLKDLVTEISECTDGAQAVEAYAKFLPDFVTMDLRMPRMDGFEATRRILIANPSARIIVVSQSARLDLQENARRAGAWHFVQKDNLVALRQYLESSL